jgi:isocitrate dehydrogenase
VKVWPNGLPETYCTDHWRCRFKSDEQKSSTYREILALQSQLVNAGFQIIKTENLVTFDGVPAFSAGQGA